MTGPFKIETDAGLTHNVEPLMHEIRHAVQALLDTGETKVIDLRSLPLAPGELEVIETTLGRGEVNAVLDAMGPSEISETMFPGVWLVRHFNADKQAMGVFVEITCIPSLLLSQNEDIADGLQQLDEQLKTMF